MRRVVQFVCDDATLYGTLDEGPSTTGLLIVSGGNEIRIGAHRGMAQLAQTIAAIGYPVFRFDRRGIGDSEGKNEGFQSSKPDIAAALDAFRVACPHVERFVGFGNCDAATALILHDTKVHRLVLANPWVVQHTDGLPPPSAIKDRYARRVRDGAAWRALMTGKIDICSAFRGARRIYQARTASNDLADRVATTLTEATTPTTILLAVRDNTAISFAEAWQRQPFEAARNRADISVVRIDSASHSFANETDFAILVETLTTVLAQ